MCGEWFKRADPKPSEDTSQRAFGGWLAWRQHRTWMRTLLAACTTASTEGITTLAGLSATPKAGTVTSAETPTLGWRTVPSRSTKVAVGCEGQAVRWKEVIRHMRSIQL